MTNKENILDTSVEQILPMLENENEYRRKILKGLHSQGIKTVNDFLQREINPQQRRAFNDSCYAMERDIRDLLRQPYAKSILLKIPFYEDNDNYSLKEKINLFLKQYVEKLQYTSKGKEYATLISQSLGLDGVQKTNEEIGNSLPQQSTRERVRQKIAEAMDILNDKEFQNIKINPVFLDEIKKLKDKSLYHDVDDFKKFIGDINVTNAEVNKIANIIALEITGIGDDINHMTDQQFIVNKDEVVIFKSFIKKIVNLMRDEFLPLPVNYIINKLDKSEKYIEIIGSILQHHKWIEVVTDKEDEVCYQLKWQYLSSVSSKAKRIIFEATKTISKNEILEEYNRRSNNDSICKEQLIIQQDEKDNFHAHKNGTYYYSKVKKAKVEDFILDYIIENEGKVSFDNVLYKIKNEGYNYPENTIRTYILTHCLVAQNDSNLFIHKDFKKKYPEFEVIEPKQQNVGNSIVSIAVEYLKQCPDNRSKSIDCINHIYNTTTLNLTKGNINQYIQKLLVDTNIIIKKEVGNRKYDLVLDLDELQKYDLGTIGKRNQEPEWRKKICALTINYLKKQDDYKARLSDLYKNFSAEIPDEISNNVFYKLFNDNPLFRKEENQKKQYVVLNWRLLPEAKVFTENVSEPIVLEKSTYSEQEKIVYEPFDLEKLKIKLLTEIGGYFDGSIDVQAAINLFIEYLKVKNTLTSWGEGILKSIYDLFYSKTDYYDRDSYLYRIVMNYEAYLKNIKKIKDNGYDSTVVGFNAALDLFEETQQLKEKDLYNKTVQSRFAKICSSLHYYRNQFGHSANELELSLFQQVKTAMDNIALYVYTAWILRN
jgi:hypothetical protein